MKSDVILKSDVFLKELSYIKDDKIRNSAKTVLEALPDYFYRIEASSTGKYHPKFTLGKVGLVRHVKVAVKFGYELFNIYKFDDETKDLIIMAILIHDGLKKGRVESQYTVHDHPVLIGKYVQELSDSLEINDEQIARVAKMVSSHMGKWTTNPYNDVVLPLPQTVEEKFVHMCDYLSSKKFIDVEFDEENNILE